MLKEWLVRRRENPYPSREEKKHLAIETGLTYTQICNWFANWRRKLKNSEREKSKKSWGHLIKHYNNNAKGNVEQFSISSEDSIWDEEEQLRRNKMHEHILSRIDYNYEDGEGSSLCDVEGSNESIDVEHNGRYDSRTTQSMDVYCKPNYYMNAMSMNQNPVELFMEREIDVMATAEKFQIITNSTGSSDCTTKTKYKQKIMEKYLRDMSTNDEMLSNSGIHLQCVGQNDEQVTSPGINGNNTQVIKSKAEFSKWLESAAKFTPNKNNYFIEWNSKRNKLEKRTITAKTCLPNASPINFQPSNTTVAMLPLLYAAKPSVEKENDRDFRNSSLDQQQYHHTYDVIHHKDELDAAEALANLAFNCRQKMLDSATSGRNSISWTLNTISS